ncbi:hypothetical protein [Aureispira sp. CCB-E]|uniref:hypothetical protein n=1 Tax=Aureispira sp. CCB-E TaxID=3051121 RepID=UPI0028696514|nr:hypothetical protein [Aureispira sp. CCB-E]WMX13103.1 hypothetical protein QP953_19875 [Aureispira sp. CCB-E]
MLNSKLEQYITEKTSIDKKNIPADLYFSEEILRPLDQEEIEVEDKKKEANVVLSVKPIKMSKYNYEGKEIYVPIKAISKILNPNKIV